MEDIDLKQYALRLENLSTDALCDMVNDVIANRETIIKHLNSISEKLYKTAYANTEKFNELVLRK